MSKSKGDCRGLFVVGTDTDVGKTQVAARIAAELCRAGVRVGVYKPAASGCRAEAGELVSDDAFTLWQAAGQPGELAAVCPQRFAAPLAPHLAARAEGRPIDAQLLRHGLDYWRQRSDFLIVEGAGGLMSPLGDSEYVADLAADFQLPLVVVVPNKIGAINQVLQTLIAAKAFRGGPNVAGIVLNNTMPADQQDPSAASNGEEIRRHCQVPLLTTLAYGAGQFDSSVNWQQLG